MLNVRWTTAIVIAAISFASWTTWATFVSKKSAAQIDDLKDGIAKRSEDNAKLEREIADAKRKLRALNERADVKERLIREDVGLIKQDELIFNFAPQRGDNFAPQKGDNLAPQKGDNLAPQKGDNLAPQNVAPQKGDHVAPERRD